MTWRTLDTDRNREKICEKAQEKHDVKMEERLHCHEPRNVWDYQKLEEARNGPLLHSFRGHVALPVLWFHTSSLQGRETIVSIVLSHCMAVLCYSCPRKWTQTCLKSPEPRFHLASLQEEVDILPPQCTLFDIHQKKKWTRDKKGKGEKGKEERVKGNLFWKWRWLGLGLMCSWYAQVQSNSWSISV